VLLYCLIEDAVIAQEADKLGISLSEAEIQMELEQAFGYFADGTPTPTITATPYSTATLSEAQLALVPSTPTPIATTEPEPAETAEEAEAPPAEEVESPPVEEPPTPTPAPTSTPYTEEGFQARVTEYTDALKDIDFKETDLRELVVSLVLRERVQEALTADVSAEEEQVWVRHILVETEDEALAVLDRLEAGEDWSDLAAELSLDDSNKDRSGDLGWFGPGRMVPPFEEAAYALEFGEVSSPVATDFGYHILQLLGKETLPVDDLKRADTDLRQVISELDVLITERFKVTFDATAIEFRQMFRTLFGGGSARLVMIEEDNPAESGIDIEARLPGRRETGLALLSGGERSLTAVALIFSLLKVSPTPFCVLDEVDAMLDEANVGRFNDLLRELSESTQFILVTHNRRTVQTSDVIYGVTMGRDSSSKIISLRLDELDDAIIGTSSN